MSSWERGRAIPIREALIGWRGAHFWHWSLNGERYPQTRQHLLTMDDVQGMSIEQMRYAINEVYARYGATFPNVPDIQRQFQKFEWYHPKPGLTFEEVDRLMSNTERQNVEFLAQCRELKRSK